MLYDLAIIGGGPAGYTAAEYAGKSGLSVILFEKNSLGGVCLNEGCIPTKTLLYSAKVFNTAQNGTKYGINVDNVSFDISKIIARKNKVVKKLTAGIRMKLKEAGVEVVIGNAYIKGKSEVNGCFNISVSDVDYEASKLLLCTGSETIIPPIPGLLESDFITSKEALQMKEIPNSILVIGGGVIGMEFASFYNSLGTEVFVVEMFDKILGPMDRELSEQLQSEYIKKGVKFYLGYKVLSVSGNEVIIEKEGERKILVAEKILLSTGRKPVLSGLGLENLKLENHKNGIAVDSSMKTSVKDIYACGDITGFSLLAHTAVAEAKVAINTILGKEHKMTYKAVPGVVYTNPEFACVGKTEEELQKEQITYQVKKIPMSFSGRFVAENEMTNGVCKLLFDDKNCLIGAHLLGNPASELIVILGICIEKGLKSDEIASFIFPHPTVGEIIQEALS